MDDIQRWLKSLRLHKYSNLFAQLTYQQMLDLDEDYLVAQGVTKGARNKMLVSIQKLKARKGILTYMIYDIQNSSISIKEALNILKDMLVTPMSPVHTAGTCCSELPDLYVSRLGMVIDKLLECATADRACHNIACAIIDDCLRHDIFNPRQKDLIDSYRHRLRKTCGRYIFQQSNTNPKAKRQHPYNVTAQQPPQQQAIAPRNRQLQNHNPRIDAENSIYECTKFNSNLHLTTITSNMHSSSKTTSNGSPSPTSSSDLSFSTSSSLTSYGEYSLLGPGATFELECLRKHR